MKVIGPTDLIPEGPTPAELLQQWMDRVNIEKFEKELAGVMVKGEGYGKAVR